MSKWWCRRGLNFPACFLTGQMFWAGEGDWWFSPDCPLEVRTHSASQGQWCFLDRKGPADRGSFRDSQKTQWTFLTNACHCITEKSSRRPYKGHTGNLYLWVGLDPWEPNFVHFLDFEKNVSPRPLLAQEVHLMLAVPTTNPERLDHRNRVVSLGRSSSANYQPAAGSAKLTCCFLSGWLAAGNQWKGGGWQVKMKEPLLEMSFPLCVSYLICGKWKLLQTTALTKATYPLWFHLRFCS